MSRRTKKTGRTGKFGSRYGLSVKKQIKAIETNKSSRFVCPRCMKTNVRRVSSGIWECRSCNHKFVGGAYTPKTGKYRAIESRMGRM
jgi:large subunit ribosomal protein L37Ae